METCEELLSVMETLNSLHRELVCLEEDKISLIIGQNWEGLEEAVEKSRTVLNNIERIEKKRVEIVKLFDSAATDNPPPVSKLLRSIPEQFRAPLTQASEALRSSMLQLKELNRRSEQLLSGSLEVVDFTLSLLSGAGSKGRTYSGDGEERIEGREHPSLVFDVKA
jgi:flagellar biosynthesis/type III secretory pathway chaperone